MIMIYDNHINEYKCYAYKNHIMNVTINSCNWELWNQDIGWLWRPYGSKMAAICYVIMYYMCGHTTPAMGLPPTAQGGGTHEY